MKYITKLDVLFKCSAMTTLAAAAALYSCYIVLYSFVT